MTAPSAPWIVALDMARYGPLPSGLRRRIDSRGRVRYGLDVRSRWLPGGQDRRWLPPGTLREDAERRLREVLDMIDKRKRGLPVDDAGDEPLASFRDVANEYIDELKAGGATPETVKLTEGALRLVAPVLGRLPVAAIRPDDVRRARDVLAEGRAPTTANRYLAVVRAVMNYALNVRRVIRWNPASEHVVPSIAVEASDKRKVRLFRPEEDVAFLKALPLKYAAAWAMSLYIGHRLRRTALCRMRVEDVDLLARTVTVRGANVKRAARKVRSRRPRETVVLPIPNRALYYVTELVKAAKALGSPWLFPSDQDPSRPLTPHAFSKEFRRHATRAGYPDVYFHHSLHNFTTRAKRRGLDDVEARALREAQAARGHDSVAATQLYDHTGEDPEALRRWYDAMDRWLDEEERKAHDSPKAPPRIDPAATPH